MSLFYNRSGVISDKDLFTQNFEAQLLKFKLKDHNHKKLNILEPSPMWRVVAKTHPTLYRKHEFPLVPYEAKESHSSVEIVYRKEKVDSFTWHTTAEKLKEAVRWGIVHTDSITAKAIGALGRYRLMVHERISEGYIGNRYHEKMALLDVFQDRFEALEKLESLVNQNISYGEKPIAYENLKQAIKDYIEVLENLQKKAAHYNLLAIDDDILRAKVYLEDITKENFDDFNSATGVASILEFVKTQMILNLREMQGKNQCLTYDITDHSFAATRGDLNGCIEDAMKLIEDHDADPHNRIHNEHHGIYGANKDRVAFNSQQYAMSAEQEQQALLAISYIEGINKIEFDEKYENPTLVNRQGKFALEVVKTTKWHFVQPGKSLKAWAGNIAARLVGGILDLAFAPLTITLKYVFRWRAPREYLNWLATYDFNKTETERADEGHGVIVAGYALRDAAKRPFLSLSTRLGIFALNVYENIFVDLFRGLRDVASDMTFKFVESLQNYFADGKKKSPFDLVMFGAETEVKNIKDNKAVQFHTLMTKIKTQRKMFKPRPEDEMKEEKLVDDAVYLAERFAVPEYTPTAGEWNDLFNAAARGGKQFIGVFLHHIYAKNPMAGMMFTLAYIAGGLSILAPELISKYVPAQFIAFSQKLGSAMAPSHFSSALAAGANESQMAAALWEMLIHGPHSWAATGLSAFAKDPVTVSVYSGAAVAIGSFIAWGPLQIPGLSEELRGSPNPMTLGFGGAKIGFLFVELLHEKKRGNEVLVQSNINKLKKELDIIYRHNHSRPSEQNQDVYEVEVTNFVEIQTVNLLRRDTLVEIEKIFHNAENNLKMLESNAVFKEQCQEITRRFQIMAFLEENRHDVPYLSARRKHELMQQMKLCNFTKEDAASFKKVLYPEESRSILRTTIGLFAGYVTGKILLLAGFLFSVYHGNWKPLESAYDDYAAKITTDKTRLIRAGSTIANTIVGFARRVLIKTPLDVISNSILARAFTWVTKSNWLTSLNYRVSGWCDALYEDLRQRFSTWSGLNANVKAVTAAHPADTSKKVADSYIRMFQTLVPGDVARDVEEKYETSLEGVVSSKGKQDLVPESTSKNINDVSYTQARKSLSAM